jgi:hypothetical protein
VLGWWQEGLTISKRFASGSLLLLEARNAWNTADGSDTAKLSMLTFDLLPLCQPSLADQALPRFISVVQLAFAPLFPP